VLDQLLALEGTEVGLGVADVDGEEHPPIITGPAPVKPLEPSCA
jgi:hypothetical protein